jgi:hypothetical protein
MRVRQLLAAASLLGGMFIDAIDGELGGAAPPQLRRVPRRAPDRLPALRPAADPKDGVRVVTQAEFEVKVLRITAFEYNHRNEELWSGRCLQAIESTTNSNGTPTA